MQHSSNRTSGREGPISIIKPFLLNKGEWKSFSLPSVSSLPSFDLYSNKPALKHLRRQFCLSLVSDHEDDCKEVIEEEEDSKDSLLESAKADFDAEDDTSDSFYGSDGYNGVDEMAISEDEQLRNNSSVQHCIDKFNSRSKTEMSSTKTTSNLTINFIP